MKQLVLLSLASVCVVRLTAASATPNDATPWTNKDAEVEMSSESTLCMAYYAVARQCAINSGRQDAGDAAMQAMTAANNLATATATAAGEADSAILAQDKVATDQVQGEIHGSCMNMATAAVKYGLPCKGLMETPITRFCQLQAAPPSSSWP